MKNFSTSTSTYRAKAEVENLKIVPFRSDWANFFRNREYSPEKIVKIFLDLDLEGRGRGLKSKNAPISLGLVSFFQELSILPRKSVKKFLDLDFAGNHIIVEGI